jgi:hypothetical protein
MSCDFANKVDAKKWPKFNTQYLLFIQLRSLEKVYSQECFFLLKKNLNIILNFKDPKLSSLANHTWDESTMLL